MENYHIPVLPKEVVDSLKSTKAKIIIDGTVGGGGHSELLLKSNSKLRLVCVDRDEEALTYAKERLKSYKSRTKFIHLNFKEIVDYFESNNLKADGILLDLGVSSHQIDDFSRGFSFRGDAKLDMRMDKSCGITAEEVVNNYTETELVEIFSNFGEEKFSKRIAKEIVSNRPIQTTLELKAIVENLVNKINRHETLNSVQRVFQAIRIEVNSELDGLYDFIVSLPNILNSGARVSIITFHSLEDRIVKRAFSELTTECVCPPKVPICVCNHHAKAKLVTHKPITATDEELESNLRSRSAKLRVVEIL